MKLIYMFAQIYIGLIPKSGEFIQKDLLKKNAGRPHATTRF